MKRREVLKRGAVAVGGAVMGSAGVSGQTGTGSASGNQEGRRFRGDALDLEIRLTHPPAWGTYRLPGLVLRLDGKDTRVDVDGRVTRRTIRGIRRAPTKVEVDPEGWWLLGQ